VILSPLVVGALFWAMPDRDASALGPSVTGVKITIIGGGSYQWSARLVSDILNLPALADAEIVLEDIDPAPLPKMAEYCGKLAAHLGVGATFSTTTDQRAALDGADFVVVTISTGGFESMAHDLGVPARHGILQSVGDTVGPGGIARSLRNIPVLVSIARDLQELSPDAWLLNITNPMTALTRACLKETSVKTVGLCHEVGNFCLQLSKVLGVEYESIRPVITGVNHLPVVTELTVGGEDGFAIVRDLMKQGEATAWLSENALKLGLFERFGAIPAAGDRHVAEFLPGFLTEESGWGKEWGVALTSIEDREGWQRWFIERFDKALAEPPRRHRMSGEMAAYVIDSLVTGEHREFPVNRPNTGQAPDLPPDVVVESMCVVDDDGITPRETVVAPQPFAEIIRRHVAVQELTVEAALEGDRTKAKAAFLLDPLAGRGDFCDMEAMVDELLDATSSWLPQF
jgi:alpha-galactosidase/6-phospho-beta-glucosidase family protein